MMSSNGYAVSFPEEHPILKKLSGIKKSKKATWFYGCSFSGKTSFVRLVFDPDYIFEYPGGHGEIKYEFSSFFKEKEPQLMRFLHEYISWLTKNVSWKIPGDNSLKLVHSGNYDELVTHLIRCHDGFSGDITWLIQVNMLNPNDSVFIDSLSSIHSKIASDNKRFIPNLIFESWFSNGSSQREWIDRTSPPLQKPFGEDRYHRRNTNYESIKQVARTFSTSLPDKEYEQALKIYISTKWRDLHESAIQILCDVIKEWSGYHLGSIQFVLRAMEENDHRICSAIQVDDIEKIIKNHTEFHDAEFKILIEDIGNSLGITTWEQHVEHQKREDLWDVGINIAQDKKDVQLIKLIELYKESYQSQNKKENGEKTMNEITLLAMSAVQFAKWLWPVAQPGLSKVSEAVGIALAKSLTDLFGEQGAKLKKFPDEQEGQLVEKTAEILSSEIYPDKDLLRNIQQALNQLLSNSDNYVLQDGLYELYKKYVALNSLGLVVAKHALNPQAGMAQEIVQYATVERRLPELIQDMQNSML